VLKGVTLRATATALAAANQRARDAGVVALPTLAVGGELFSGLDCLELVHAALARS
jgi:2-hydroxychromene-2-carboxylate isomerase